MLQAYRQHVAERAALGIPPLPLSAKQTAELIELLKAPPAGEEKALVELITYRVPAGVDDAAKVKASYLAALARDQADGEVAMRHRRQEARLDLGRVVDAGRHAVRQQVDEEALLARRRVLDQLDQLGGLWRRQRQRRNAEGGAFGRVLAVGLQHDGVLLAG
jgi:hypothetical protein